MTLDTEQRHQTAAPAGTEPKPPPQAGEERGHRLFQTMGELRARQGDALGTKHQIIHVAAALIGGLLLFAALYAVILFLEAPN